MDNLSEDRIETIKQQANSTMTTTTRWTEEDRKNNKKNGF